MVEQNNIQQSQAQIKEKKSCRTITALKIIVIILNVLLIAFLSVELFSTMAKPDGNAKGIAIAAYLVFIVIVIGGISAIVMTLLSLMGMIITIVMRKKCQIKGHLIFFIIFTILPAIIEIAFVLITKAIS